MKPRAGPLASVLADSVLRSLWELCSWSLKPQPPRGFSHSPCQGPPSLPCSLNSLKLVQARESTALQLSGWALRLDTELFCEDSRRCHCLGIPSSDDLVSGLGLCRPRMTTGFPLDQPAFPLRVRLGNRPAAAPAIAFQMVM